MIFRFLFLFFFHLFQSLVKELEFLGISCIADSQIYNLNIGFKSRVMFSFRWKEKLQSYKHAASSISYNEGFTWKYLCLSYDSVK